MSMLTSIINQNKEEKITEPAIDGVSTETTVETVTEAPAELPLECSQPKQKIFKVKFSGKKYKVPAESEEEAVAKIKELLGIDNKVEIQEESPKITISDIFNAISEEIKRIVTVAHPEVVTNNYDRWAAVITEELGEIVHEINDQHEGKAPTKNLYVECVQLASATILLAKKYAREHPEMFIRGDK